MKARRYRFVVWPLLCVLAYVSAGKESVAVAISDTSFLIGIAALIRGLFGLVKKSGFFFGAADGISRFKALLANRPAPGESLADSYAAHIGRYSSDTVYRAYLAIGAALIAVAALFAML